jgi:SAM-dependent methyltransferase
MTLGRHGATFALGLRVRGGDGDRAGRRAGSVRDKVTEALEAFRPIGSVLELACGPGVWTRQLLRHAAEVMAVDASPEMLAIAAARVGDERVRFVQADLFAWVPDRRYDVVFIGFWLSHVPLERFESFWSLVADCLKADGRVFFADDGYRTPTNSLKARRPPRSAAGSTTERPTGW